MDYLQTERRIAFVPDVRLQRRADILFALEHEPLTLKQAFPLLEELGELAADLQSDPPEELIFGSKEWFATIQEIPLKGDQTHGNSNH